MAAPRSVLLAALMMAAVVGLAAASGSGVRGTNNKEVIKGSYIVVFHANATEDQRGRHMTMLGDNAQVSFTYNMTTFKGYAAAMNAAAVSAALADEMTVDFVEADQTMRTNQAACSLQTYSTWGLVRTVEHALDIDGNYHHKTNDGEGVSAYIIDTGIYTGHSLFAGRAVWGTDTVDSPSPKTDENGHGTHVAGTVGADTFGLARKATLIAVKVLGRDGSGSNAGVIAGVNWAATDAKKKSKGKSVANLSLGGGLSSALNNAVSAAQTDGLVMVVAAGNDNKDACNYSPASSNAITVASSANTDRRSSFSNWGSCADMFAPGSDITSTWINGPTSINTISGTSMASPHVAGVVAKLLGSSSSFTPASVKTWLRDNGTQGTITDTKNTPNVLLFKGCD